MPGTGKWSQSESLKFPWFNGIYVNILTGFWLTKTCQRDNLDEKDTGTVQSSKIIPFDLIHQRAIHGILFCVNCPRAKPIHPKTCRFDDGSPTSRKGTFFRSQEA
jgi:hypothetical protein